MNNHTQSQHISCILVLFNPVETVLMTINKLVSTGYKVIIVINAAAEPIITALSKIRDLSIIHNTNNLGLATALNMGIKHGFLVNQADFVALFDQDSQPEHDQPLKLVNEMIDQGLKKIACIGPKLMDIKNLSIPYSKDNCPVDNAKPKSIPTSGTVISKQAWHDVGSMMDELFIDGIDHEWCFRAYSKGYQVCVSTQTTMLHNLGDTHLNYFGQYKPVHREPTRHFFIVRNALFLSSLKHLPLKWRVMELIKTIRRIIFYIGVSSDRAKTLQLIRKALKDGLAGRLGPLA